VDLFLLLLQLRHLLTFNYPSQLLHVILRGNCACGTCSAVWQLGNSFLFLFLLDKQRPSDLLLLESLLFSNSWSSAFDFILLFHFRSTSGLLSVPFLYLVISFPLSFVDTAKSVLSFCLLQLFNLNFSVTSIGFVPIKSHLHTLF
jgi:hypothetical protein